MSTYLIQRYRFFTQYNGDWETMATYCDKQGAIARFHNDRTNSPDVSWRLLECNTILQCNPDPNL
jgi:hypothetical protein